MVIHQAKTPAILILFCFIANFHCQAQEITTTYSQSQIDSLWLIEENQLNNKLSLALDSENSIELGQTYLMLGELNLQQNCSLIDYELAFQYLSDAITYIDSGDIPSLARCYELLGDYARYTSATVNAIQYYDQSFKHYQSLKNDNKCGTVLHRKGDCILDQKNYVLAEESYIRAIDFYKKVNNVDMIASCTSNIGEIYERKGDYQKALYQFNKAFQMVQNPEMRAYIQFEIGKIYLDSLHVQNRDSLFLNSLQYLKSINRLDGIGYAHLLLGKTYLKDGRYDLSKENLLKGLTVVESIKAEYKMQMAYETLIELYTKQKDYQNALFYTNLLNELTQRVYDQEKGRYIKDIETKYEVEKKNTALAQSQREKEIAQRQRNLIIVFVIILAILLIILWVYQNRLKKSNKMLVEKKNEIETINSDLEKTVNYKNILLKEVHHRVKNNLQIICSILEMQIDASGSLRLREKLQSSIDRIFSMALVHEQLYTEDSEESIDAYAYFNDIIDSIVSSQQSQTKEINVEMEMDEIQLNLNVALPLGMILNELITNAFKYAFSETSFGQVMISLKSYGSDFILLISDNGKGIDISQSRKNSIGMQLADDFVTQIGGQMTLEVKQGTHYQIKFPRH